MTQKSYDDIPLVLPTLAIQKGVASVLRLLDKKIEINNRLNIGLEATAQLIYNHWFVQFDFPDANNRPLLSRAFVGLKLGAQYA